MDTVDVSHAKKHLEELIARAAKGEDICVTDPGGGTVKLVAIAAAEHNRPKRVIGQWKDKFDVPARLFEPLSEDELRWLSGEASA